MPWSPKQHRLFCARCKDGKGDKEMCKLCHEGKISSDMHGEMMNEMVKKKAAKK